jgi:DHA2 family multidrug resistance protein
MAAIGFVVFVIWELTDEHPVVDLRIFRHRGFTTAVVTLALCFGAYFASIVVIPQWLQISMGYTATQAGLVTAFTAMSALVTSQVAARMTGKVDPRLMISMAVAWLGIMALVRTGWTSDADFWSLAMPQILQGFAMSFFMIPLTTISMGAVLPEETASAAGLQNFLRTMAVAVSTSIALTVWGNAQRVAHNELTSKLQPDDVQAKLASLGMSADQATEMIGNLVEREAVTMAVNHTFMIAAVVLFVAAALVWVAPRPKGPVDTSAAH